MSFLPDSVVIESISSILDRTPSSLDFDLSFTQHGGNSLSAVALVSLCKRRGVLISIGTILRSHSLKELLISSTFIDGPEYQLNFWPPNNKKQGQEPLHHDSPITVTHTDEMSTIMSTAETADDHSLAIKNETGGLVLAEAPPTHIQNLMIRDSVQELGTNIVRYYETYKSEDIPTIKASWNSLFMQEAILRSGYSENLEPLSHTCFDWTEMVTRDTIQFDAWVNAPISHSDIRSSWQVVSLDCSDRPQCNSKSTVIWTVHHALVDGYSARILLLKLRALAAGKSVSAGPPYAEVAKAIQDLDYNRRREGELFWNRENELYEKSRSSLQLPPPHGAHRSRGTGESFISLGTNSQIIQMISRECSVTPAAIFYSAWAVVLTILADSEIVIFGTAVLGRNLPIAGIEDVIGPLFTTPPFAASVNGERTLREFVSEVFSRMTDLTEHHWTIPKHILCRGVQSALFIGFEFDTLNEDDPIRPVEPPFWKHDSALPLTILVGSEETCFQYRSEEFRGASIEQVSLLFDRTIRSFIRLDLSIRSLQTNLVMPETQFAIQIHENLFSPLTRPLSISDDLVTLFERSASLHPKEIAIDIGSHQLTYSELDNQIGIIAKAIGRVSKKQEIVCVEADRSVSWIIGIFAVLKAGAIYCPLDPELPEEMRAFIVKNTCATALLCNDITLSSSSQILGFQHLLGVQRILAQNASLESEEFPRRALPDPSKSAYINVFEALNMADSAIMTPSVAEILDPYDYPQLKHVYLVGEPVKQSTNDRWAAVKKTYNMYGPTEGTCGATICRLQPGKPITIGRPNPTTRLYILDSRLRSVPVGVVGEIHVAGIQVARGYLGMVEATAARFVADPFCQGTHERMFKTGDRGYWTQGGEIVCLGRNDRQIKLRGYRLDLDDLEIRATRAVKGIKSVAMVVRRDHLVAAIQPSTLDRKVIAAAFAKVLPGYAQPRDIILTDKFPTTNAGKLDYKEVVSCSKKELVIEDGPLTSMETMVAQTWREVLNLQDSETINATSNFLQLGGSSLLQMTLLSRLSTRLKMRVPLRLIIKSHSLRELATCLEDLRLKVNSQKTTLKPTRGPHKLSPLEKDWWSKYNLAPEVNTKSFNVSCVFYFEPNSLDRVLLERAWNSVLSRYTLFKSRYLRAEGTDSDVERRYAENPPHVELVQHVDVKTEINKMFDIGKQPPMRVILTQCQLIIVASHIIADLHTFQILFRDVKAIYHGGTLSPVQHIYELQPTLGIEGGDSDIEFWSQYLEGAASIGHGKVKSITRKSFDGNSRLYRLPQPLAKSVLEQLRGGDHLSLQQLAIATVALVIEVEKEETDIVLGTPFTNRTTDAERETVGLFLQPLPIRVQYPLKESEMSAKPYLSEVRRSAAASLAHVVPWNDLLDGLHIATNCLDNPIFNVMVTFHTPDVMAKLDIPGLVPCLSWSDGSKFLLLIEFTALDAGDVVLRVEYDTHYYSAADIDTLAANITTALSMLVSDRPCSEIKRAIRTREGDTTMAIFEGDVMGRPLKMRLVGS
ncbi:hypothetical protein NPX13_g9121 [Xylaria arbuscula]|uniref:Carrier domain-containing protein n=1 Tax=Xylaria arbuscula TaxID=114810 RepID=A0A9W8N7K5_9PEZI|nr:hypothetical protein NPX13_g9121 [Xylaria arbuscula]